MDCIWVNLKNVGPPFFKFTLVHIKMSYTQLENHSQLLYGRDFANDSCSANLTFKAQVKRHTSHEPNRMQMRKTLCCPSLAFDSAHVKYSI